MIDHRDKPNQNEDSDGIRCRTADNTSAASSMPVTPTRSSHRAERRKHASPSLTEDNPNNTKTRTKVYKIEVDSSDDTTSRSSSDTGMASHTGSENHQHEYDHGWCQDRYSLHCKLIGDTTLINREVLSRLLKTLDRESKFKNAVLDRHLDIIENVLLDREASDSSSDEE